MGRLGAAVTLCIVLMVIIIPATIVWLFGGPAAGGNLAKSRGYRGEEVPVKVYMHETNEVVELALEEYIKGVVAAEMPAEFELEALKAQAVAARTYVVKHMLIFGGAGVSDRPGADISTDTRQGQAWVSEAKMRERWGGRYDSYRLKISKAVEDTRGMIMTWQGEPINAVFHSTAGPQTASAKEVWGFDYPYLQSVACSWDQQSPRYQETKEITLAELEKALGPESGIVAAAQSGDRNWAKILSRTPSGRVEQVRIGNKMLSGTELRERLNLRSANFEVDNNGAKLVFHTIGYGHGVGMSQYGSNGMAKSGKLYRDILTYFYSGVALKNIYGS